MMDKLSTVKARPTRLAHCEDIFCTVSVLSSYSSQFARSERMWGLYSITFAYKAFCATKIYKDESGET